ncbi:glycoside hydrolase family 95 protein [Catalinimonas sp. 4WD22]|uniref:glycoside hydrolase family 95 protein n=1 Tax=Catalinimonas locisalis TaxID=3133978 RepID=UPI003100B018
MYISRSFSYTYIILIYSLLSCQPTTENQIPDSSDAPSPLRLWYDEPAEDWMLEALPIGNGYMGAMFFGNPAEEHIQFTEESLWAGGPGAHKDYHFGIREGAAQYLPEVRALLKDGKMEEAHQLANQKMTGEIHKKEGSEQAFGDFGSQQTMGDLFITVDNEGEVKNYFRELDLNEGVGKVSYQSGDVQHKRVFFGNYPKRIMVYHFSNTHAEGRTYRIRYETPHQKINDKFVEHTYSFEGEVKDNGMRFATSYHVVTPEGEVKFSDGEIIVNKAKSMTIIHTAATDYLPEFPNYKGNNYQVQNSNVLEMVEGLSFEALAREHLSDYQPLFHSVKLKLGDISYDSLPTDERQIAYAEGNDDTGLEALYFQYGRYLMISGSRPGTMPLNLQGKWNNSTNPPWANDYHFDINEQMLYWPAEVTNLSECHEPLLNYIETLVEPGQLAAKEHFGTRGWIVNTMNNPFGFTAPGWDFPWGFYPGGAAWLCQHLWEHYAFTQDTTYLQEQAFPIMKEAALFWIDYLTEDEDGYLVSSPSYSPEHGGISTGASMDHQMAWDLLNNCVLACEVLNIESDFKNQVKTVRDQILSPQIGHWGQLQEWKEDVDDPENHHRHVSHLFALHPGKQITVTKTPDLAEAAKVSLNARGDEGTGWSLAWKVSFWARLKDGDRAYKLLKKVLTPVTDKGYNMSDGGGSYSNLLCAHPPFQLDGNMGSTAGIAEMLIQSHTNEIELLPALPFAWKDGSVKGLKARGNFEIQMEWKNQQLVNGKLISNNGSKCILKYEGQEVEIDTEKNKTYLLEEIFNL